MFVNTSSWKRKVSIVNFEGQPGLEYWVCFPLQSTTVCTVCKPAPELQPTQPGADTRVMEDTTQG